MNGFRKGFSPQHCLLAMLRKWRLVVDNERNFDPLASDKSKVFCYHSYDPWLTKLNAYGFSLPALKLIQNCLWNRKQKTD